MQVAAAAQPMTVEKGFLLKRWRLCGLCLLLSCLPPALLLLAFSSSSSSSSSSLDQREQQLSLPWVYRIFASSSLSSPPLFSSSVAWHPSAAHVAPSDVTASPPAPAAVPPPAPAVVSPAGAEDLDAGIGLLQTNGSSAPIAHYEFSPLHSTPSSPPTYTAHHLPPLPTHEAAPLLRPQLRCDISQGKWVQDNSYPLYRPASCPYVDEAFDCQPNGRPDSEYLKWRWQPKDCDMPRFNSTRFMEVLRGKRLVFAGDSLMRNQWESMLCLLREPLLNKSRMFETRGQRITKGKGDYSFKILDFDLKVEFYRSHFLVAEGKQPKPGRGKSRLTLRLDTIDRTAKRWRQANILVFTTGHWWTHGKTARGKDYFQEGNTVHPSLPVLEAFKRALTTWAAWVDKNVNPSLTKVFFCGYSPAHFNGGQWNSGGQCHKEVRPISNESHIPTYPDKMVVAEDVIRQMQTPVKILNITRFSEYRKDAHPSIYGHIETNTRQDCSHWCLPGLPDIWNEVLYSMLVMDQ